MSLPTKNLASLIIKKKLAEHNLTEETIQKSKKFEHVCAELHGYFAQMKDLQSKIISTLNANKFDLDTESGFFVFDQIEEAFAKV